MKSTQLTEKHFYLSSKNAPKGSNTVSPKRYLEGSFIKSGSPGGDCGGLLKGCTAPAPCVAVVYAVFGLYFWILTITS